MKIKQFFCKHSYRETKREFIKEYADWSEFNKNNANYNIDPQYFNQFLIEEECISCGKNRRDIVEELILTGY